MASTGKMMRRDGGWLDLSGVRGWRLVGRNGSRGFRRRTRRRGKKAREGERGCQSSPN